MTKYIFKDYIPKDDIKVKPRILVQEIYNLLDKEKNDNSFDDITSKNNLKYINSLYKIMKKLLVNYDFWNRVAAYDFCCYQFRKTKEVDENGEEIIGKICGRRIDIKHDKNDRQKYFCSEHNRKHKKLKAKPIKIDNKKRCYVICNNGDRCKYRYLTNGVCEKHLKYGKNNNKIYVYNLNINKIRIIEKTCKNYVKLFENKKLKLEPLEIKNTFNNNIISHISPVPMIIDNKKHDIIKIIDTINEENKYKLLYIYKFLHEKTTTTTSSIHKRTIMTNMIFLSSWLFLFNKINFKINTYLNMHLFLKILFHYILKCKNREFD